MSDKKYTPVNPLAVIPCGVKDDKAQFPETVHYDCKECRKALIAVLESRREAKPQAPAPVQTRLFSGLRPKR